MIADICKLVVMAAAVLCFTGAVQAEETVVVPNIYTSLEGPSSNVFPLFAIGWTPYRTQQVYDGTELGAGYIIEIAFRQDHMRSDTDAPDTFADLSVVISSTSAGPDELSTNMDDNLGADARTLFDGDLVLSTTASSADPRPFDIIIPVDPPFRFDGAPAHFLLEVRAGDDPPFVTFHDYVSGSTGDSVSRLMCWGAPGCLSGDPANSVDSGGVVTRFTFAPMVFMDGFESGDTSAWAVVLP